MPSALFVKTRCYCLAMTEALVRTQDASTRTTLEADYITDKRGYGARWHFSVRHVDNLLAQGLTHCKVGNRRVRIIVPEADTWMRQRFGIQRRGPLRTTTPKQEP